MSDMNGLTEKQDHILRYIVTFVFRFHYQPSYQQIADHFDFSSLTAVRDHLQALERKGWLKQSGQPRSLILSTEAIEKYDLPGCAK